jgi:uncharacterized membrane protein
MGVRYIARAAVIASLYTAVTYFLRPLSYGPIQIRISEALTLLPLLDNSSIPGLFAGCFLANIIGGQGPWDIYGGSLITLTAAYITSKMPGPILGSVPPIMLNAIGVSYYLSVLYDLPYWITVLYVGTGQLVSVVGLGVPLYYTLKNKYFNK